MLFNSLPFAVFFVVVWAGARALPPARRAPWLLGTSLIFYGSWVPQYLVLLGITLVVNYALLRAVAGSSRPRLPLILSIVFTLGLLATFKYAAFLLGIFVPLLGWNGGTPPLLEIFLPLGISFYSFQMIALAVDTYRARSHIVPSLARYALFISFFPQLIAGPIVRGHQLLPQLEEGGAMTAGRTRRGLWLIASGLAKKVLLADYLLAPFVDSVFDYPELGYAPFQLLAVYSFAFQIYFDFSGYTDMARGLALLLGFELPLNFTEPYLSRNPAEFWRRWHITLSTWLRDYLYIPLGGNRHGRLRLAVNLMLTMLLGGLWHGASWTFVIWGGLHGVLLVGHRAVIRRRRDPEAPFQRADWLKVLLMFHAAAVLWIFFRASSLEAAVTFLGAVASGNYLVPWPLFRVAVVILCAALHVFERQARRNAAAWQERAARAWWGPPVEGFALGVLAALTVLASGRGQEFIYFQF